MPVYNSAVTATVHSQCGHGLVDQAALEARFHAADGINSAADIVDAGSPFAIPVGLPRNGSLKCVSLETAAVRGV